MSVLHGLIFVFWKPFDFCLVIFLGKPKLISSLLLKKHGSSIFLGLLARIFTNVSENKRRTGYDINIAK